MSVYAYLYDFVNVEFLKVRKRNALVGIVRLCENDWNFDHELHL